jgi:hypothetical protein
MAEELLSRLATVEDHFYYPMPKVLKKFEKRSNAR